jgi:hypothetical protein
MAVKAILIILVIVVLMEDSTSIKKSPEEEREDRDLAEKVNSTLAEEEKERHEEEEKKKGKETVKKERGSEKKKEIGNPVKVGEDEASSNLNSSSTGPKCRPCSPCEQCPEIQPCPPIEDCQECPPVKENGPCIKCKPCPRCEDPEECPPILPCPVDNTTRIHPECPSLPSCTESQMTVPVAMLVGAAATVLFTGVATVVGLVIRYVPPTVSGFLFLSTIIIVWYLSSQYPAVAREMGDRVVTTLREGSVTLGNRVMAALQRHDEQVGFPV